MSTLVELVTRWEEIPLNLRNVACLGGTANPVPDRLTALDKFTSMQCTAVHQKRPRLSWIPRLQRLVHVRCGSRCQPRCTVSRTARDAQDFSGVKFKGLKDWATSLSSPRSKHIRTLHHTACWTIDPALPREAGLREHNSHSTTCFSGFDVE